MENGMVWPDTCVLSLCWVWLKLHQYFLCCSWEHFGQAFWRGVLATILDSVAIIRTISPYVLQPPNLRYHTQHLLLFSGCWVHQETNLTCCFSPWVPMGQGARFSSAQPGAVSPFPTDAIRVLVSSSATAMPSLIQALTGRLVTQHYLSCATSP